MLTFNFLNKALVIASIQDFGNLIPLKQKCFHR